MTDNNDQARFEAQLDIIAQETPGIVWSMLVSPALDITVQFMSASMSELMGLEPEIIRENPKILLKRLTPKAQASLQRQARKSFDSGEPLRWEGHIRCRLESRWFQIRVVPVPGAETDASLWHGIAIDASHPKAIQDELVDVLIDKALINKKLQHGIEERQRAQEEILRYQERLRDLAKQVARAEENERRRIAMGLHDDVGQLLAALKMKLSSVTKQVADPENTESLASCVALVGQAIEHTRSLTFELASPLLYELGLAPAIDNVLQQIATRHELEHQFISHGAISPLPDHTRALIFSAVRELIVNVARHANATSVTVRISQEKDALHISVCDDGCGFEVPPEGTQVSPEGGFGLFNIYERLKSMDSSMTIESQVGSGTTVTLSFRSTDISF